MEYNHKKIEEKWQRYWEENKTFKVEIVHNKPKYYVLDMFPYPSGAGLHVGHPLGYIASDIYARYKKLKGFNVLHPMGFDAFGLPAEQHAIETGQHPAITTRKNISRYKEQLCKIGFSYDWHREVSTCDPKYYRWTQWAFLKMFNSWYNNKTQRAEPIESLIEIFNKDGNKNIDACTTEKRVFSADEWKTFSDREKQEILMNYRIAYLSEAMVNWCPALGTVLANDEVKDGVSIRGGHPVVRKTMKQWALRISVYAQRLLDGLEKLDWSDSIKEVQRNWIGQSDGSEIEFYLSPALSKGEGVKPRFYNTDALTWSTSKMHAQQHRKKPTEAENILWEYLRKKQIGYKIRRQHAIDRYIVDFACIEKKTVIEIDGKIHARQKEEDEQRTKILNENGFTVIRFTNEEITDNPDNVVNKIKTYLNNKILPCGEDLGGVRISVFTTRADTLFGCTFMVLAPEHELIGKITRPEYKEAVEKYVAEALNRTDRERLADVKKITGVFTGSYAIHPFTNELLPIWVADYVLSSYGTGAIMAVPAHDSRDYAFAKHFNLPIKQVIAGGDISNGSYDDMKGIVINSDFINGLEVSEAIKVMNKKLTELGIGREKVLYRLRDAIFSRQRYWGEPFPIYYKDGIPYPLEEDGLPLELPEIDSYLPTEMGEPPLSRAKSWKTKDGYAFDLNTMPGFAGSSAYYLRFMDPHNNTALVSKQANEYWRQVDLYIGGMEHATGHLIYARFWNKFLYDLGYVCEDEPFRKLINQGMIQGRTSFIYRIRGTNRFVSYNLQKDYDVTPIRVDVNIVKDDILDIDAFKRWKPEFASAEFILEDGKYICGYEIEKMSKSLHNVVNPDDIIEKYGADTLRLYEMFLGPLEQHKPWNTHGIEGTYRFLKKLWALYHDKDYNFNVSDDEPTREELKILHKTIKKVEEDIERFSFNTCISTFMICVNELSLRRCNKRTILEPLAIMISPFAPHIAEELWSLLHPGNKESISKTKFPQYNEEQIKEEIFSYPVSFNGKMRFLIELPIDLPSEEIEKQVLQAKETQKWLKGKMPKKVIVVPKKIVNIVV